jgi:septum formation protein
MKIPLTRHLTLASNSPRRRQLLAECGFEFSQEARPTDESYPQTMPPDQVAAYLSQKKAEQFLGEVPGKLVLCADTIVVTDGGTILNKPADEQEARAMLRKLSGTTHSVITGVSLLDYETLLTQSDTAHVTFRPLTDDEINYYVRAHQPFDKAGGYGIQEWIGMVGIERIEGSYYTIMGLPTHLVYQMLSRYFTL